MLDSMTTAGRAAAKQAKAQQGTESCGEEQEAEDDRERELSVSHVLQG
jgi:hypothetical protein